MIHYQLAEGILRTAQSKAANAGIRLDVGEFPETLTSDGATDDPQLPVRLVAHAVARVADRFGFVRKLSRHMEGQEKKAGIVSDVFSACVALYARNPELMNDLAGRIKQDVAAKQANRKVNNVATPNGQPHNAFTGV